jgi:hypothetical protein
MVAAYTTFEDAALLRIRRTARRFALGVVIPIFGYVFVFLATSPSVDVLLGGFHTDYTAAATAYDSAVTGGCETSTDPATCTAHARADCCPVQPSYVLQILLPSFALALAIFQLFAPVLASIMVMTCAMEVHTLHLDGVLEALVATSTAGQTTAEGQDPPTVEGRDPPTVAGLLTAFTVVKRSLDSTSKQWAAVLLAEGAIVGMITVAPGAPQAGGSRVF